ncbi:uncharacterized protein LOC129301440 [Prosopis cineraria]|uniref:uncharacterized protein LOC129301440 n=1 Tax=Prosopis cineraria TaxID=364024 RepID=UPI00240F5A96|nr:uncharacterized protein LOC129301440 [Prosopis cineraria]XP_054795977.1 uncharacterized protein LOC129301440 [Prosopis cineraria]
MAEESSSTSNGKMHRPGPCRIIAELHHGLDLLVQLARLFPTSTVGSEHEDEENENGSVGPSYSYEPTRSDEKMTTQSYQPLLDSEQLHTVEANNAATFEAREEQLTGDQNEAVGPS